MGSSSSKPATLPPPPPPDVILVPPRIHLKKEKKLLGGGNFIQTEDHPLLDYILPSSRFFSFSYTSGDIINDELPFDQRMRVGAKLWGSKETKKLGGNFNVAVEANNLFANVSLETEHPSKGSNASVSTNYFPTFLRNEKAFVEVFGSVEGKHLSDSARRHSLNTFGFAFGLSPSPALEPAGGQDLLKERLENAVARVAVSGRQETGKRTEVKVHGYGSFRFSRGELSAVLFEEDKKVKIKDASVSLGAYFGSRKSQRSPFPAEILLSASDVLSDDPSFSLLFSMRNVVSRRVVVALEKDVKRIHNYLDFSIRSTLSPKKIEEGMKLEFAGSWQINKNNMVKGAIANDEVSASYVFKNWWTPRSTVVVTSSYNLPTSKPSLGFSLLLDSEDADYKTEELRAQDFKVKGDTLRVALPQAPTGPAPLFDPTKLN